MYLVNLIRFDFRIYVQGEENEIDQNHSSYDSMY